MPTAYARWGIQHNAPSKYDYLNQCWENDGKDELYRKLVRAIISGLITEEEALAVIVTYRA